MNNLICHSLGGLAVCLSASIAMPAFAQPRTCTDKFSSEGEASTGITCKSYIDFKGVTRENALTSICSNLAKDGMLGIEVNKDLGIVSSYQENKVKNAVVKSTQIMKVIETGPGKLRVEVTIKLAPGLRLASNSASSLCETLEAISPGNSYEAQEDSWIKFDFSNYQPTCPKNTIRGGCKIRMNNMLFMSDDSKNGDFGKYYFREIDVMGSNKENDARYQPQLQLALKMARTEWF